MKTFNPQQYNEFIFESYEYTAHFSEIKLHYRLQGEAGESIAFTEEVTFPETVFKGGVGAVAVAQRIVRLLFLAAGLSYYKTAAPAKVVVMPPVSIEELHFLRTLFKDGMTEFAYVNKLRRALTPEISVTLTPAKPVALPQALDGPVVPVGGGKDSIVTIESLRQAGFTPYLFALKTYAYGSITQTAVKAGLEFGFAKRLLSPNLKLLNEQGALSGHVPITAIVSLVSMLFAVLSGHKTVVISSERSASAGNTEWEGVLVNHQWSKSLELEELLRETLAKVVSPDVTYFSLLRPLSEVAIAQFFATLKRYHAVFSSCNRAFLAPEAEEEPFWCTECPKCRFVFLMLAPFVSQLELTVIFGKNLLAENTESQRTGFSELLGIQNHKPLECVGEIEESRWAFEHIAQDSDWAELPLVQSLLTDLPEVAMPTDQQERELFAVSEKHFIPKEYMEALHAITRSDR